MPGIRTIRWGRRPSARGLSPFSTGTPARWTGCCRLMTRNPTRPGMMPVATQPPVLCVSGLSAAVPIIRSAATSRRARSRCSCDRFPAVDGEWIGDDTTGSRAYEPTYGPKAPQRQRRRPACARTGGTPTGDRCPARPGVRQRLRALPGHRTAGARGAGPGPERRLPDAGTTRLRAQAARRHRHDPGPDRGQRAVVLPPARREGRRLRGHPHPDAGDAGRRGT